MYLKKNLKRLGHIDEHELYSDPSLAALFFIRKAFTAKPRETKTEHQGEFVRKDDCKTSMIVKNEVNNTDREPYKKLLKQSSSFVRGQSAINLKR